MKLNEQFLVGKLNTGRRFSFNFDNVANFGTRVASHYSLQKGTWFVSETFAHNLFAHCVKLYMVAGQPQSVI